MSSGLITEDSDPGAEFRTRVMPRSEQHPEVGVAGSQQQDPKLAKLGWMRGRGLSDHKARLRCDGLQAQGVPKGLDLVSVLKDMGFGKEEVHRKLKGGAGFVVGEGRPKPSREDSRRGLREQTASTRGAARLLQSPRGRYGRAPTRNSQLLANSTRPSRT